MAPRLTKLVWLPILLAGVAVIVSVLGITLIATSFTPQNATPTRLLLTAVVPALTLWSLVGARIATANRRDPRDRRLILSAIVATAGIISAAAAIEGWYANVDGSESTGALWFFGATIAFATVAVTIVLVPALVRSGIAPIAAWGVGTAAGVIGGGVLLWSLFAVLVAPVVAVGSFVALCFRTRTR